MYNGLTIVLFATTWWIKGCIVVCMYVDCLLVAVLEYKWIFYIRTVKLILHILKISDNSKHKSDKSKQCWNLWQAQPHVVTKKWESSHWFNPVSLILTQHTQEKINWPWVVLAAKEACRADIFFMAFSNGRYSFLRPQTPNLNIDLLYR